MGLLEEISGFVTGITYDESLSSLLKNVMDTKIEEPSPKNYYYVTDVTNPAQTYFKRIHPDIERPPEIIRKLNRGKQLHSFAGLWFKNLPDFYADEGLLDGAWVGISGVRGKVDHRVGESLIEFKTKDSLPNTPDEIISTYPNDLEQIAFYSVIHPSNPKNNYLVFMQNSSPYELKAFKIEIRDKGTIKSILSKRIKLLNTAFTTNDISELGKCRYYESGCQYGDNAICSCAKLEPLNTAPLQKSLEITYDDEFTKQLILAREDSKTTDVFCLSIRDIIAPRKHYMELISGLGSPYSDDEKEEYKACLWESLGSLKKRQGIDLNGTERQSVIQSQMDLRAKISFRWLKMKSSVHPEGEIVPYIEKINLTEDSEILKSRPGQYFLAELGIICAMYCKNKGLIIRAYPNLDNIVQVHQITYKNQPEMLRKVISIIDLTEKAEQEKTLLSIPPCPRFMNDNEKCPLMSQCNVKGAKGCR
jgi:hypothetical protein